jgi:hypothetical protein
VRKTSTTRVRAGGLVAALALWAGGCGLLDPVVCTTGIEPAILVWVYDAATGEPAAYGAEGTVRDGAYVDPLRPAVHASPDPTSLLSFRAADERPGTYEIRVAKDGYEPWVRTGVHAGMGTCHVRTVDLDAHLVPLE